MRPGKLVVVVLAAATVFPVGLRADIVDSTTLRVLVPQSTAALPFLLMARQNPSITVATFVTHPQALAILLRGEADLLLTGTSQGWENRLDGSPLVMVDTGIWGISSLVAVDKKITGFADLKGKRIALPFPGSPLDFQTRAILSTLKLNPDHDVTISYGAFTQSIPMLMAGQLEAVALPEPQATQMVKQHGFVRVETYVDAWAAATGGDGSAPQVSLFCTQAFAKVHGQQLREVVSAWRAASEAVRADPQGTAASFAQTLQADASILSDAIGGTLFQVPDFAQNKSRVLAYYAQVRPFFPADRRDLEDDFFFVP